jgi:glutaredoxin
MKIDLYSKDNCPACVALKARLTREGESFTEIMIGKDITREEFMNKFPTVRQVPHLVYISG